MPQLTRDYKPLDQQFDMQADLVAMPKATLVRRRRIMRFGGVVTILLAAAVSVVPGPKGSAHTVHSVIENGSTTEVHRFEFSRRLGVPFSPGRVNYADDGTIKDISFSGEGFLGNLGVAFATVVVASIFIGRQRRDD